jgi:hypothetical protein
MIKYGSVSTASVGICGRTECCGENRVETKMFVFCISMKILTILRENKRTRQLEQCSFFAKIVIISPGTDLGLELTILDLKNKIHFERRKESIKTAFLSYPSLHCTKG